MTLANQTEWRTCDNGREFLSCSPWQVHPCHRIEFQVFIVKEKTNKEFLCHRRIEWIFTDNRTDLTLTYISRVHMDNLFNCLSISFFLMKHIWWIWCHNHNRFLNTHRKSKILSLFGLQIGINIISIFAFYLSV